VLNGVFYVLATGCQRRSLPPRGTVHDYLTLRAWDGTLKRLHHALFVRAREQAGKRASPTVAIVDSQSVRGVEKGPSRRSVGLKKVESKKWHILVDTLGLLLGATVHPASVQDRNGAVPLLRAARQLFPFVEVIFADGAYQDDAIAAAVARTGRWRLEIVRRGDNSGFVPLPKCWIVERTFAWPGRCRRLGKDLENLAVNALAFLCLGMIRLMLRRLARASDCS
jgi:putative transposase